MRVPLLVQAASLTCECPVVFLLPGKWAIKSNHKLCQLHLETSYGPLTLVDGMIVDGDQEVRVRITPTDREMLSIDAVLV